MASGAPANADFQQFLADLTAARGLPRCSRTASMRFAMVVLGNGYSTARAPSSDQLRSVGEAVRRVYDKSLPASPLGAGAARCFGMIFNRVARPRSRP